MDKVVKVCGVSPNECQVTLEIDGGFMSESTNVKKGDFLLRFLAPTHELNAVIVARMTCNNRQYAEVKERLAKILVEECIKLE